MTTLLVLLVRLIRRRVRDEERQELCGCRCNNPRGKCACCAERELPW